MAAPTYNAVTVGNTATLILASNPERKGCIVVNNGTVTVFIGFNASVTTSNGLPILAGGILNDSGYGELYKSAIYGVTASSTADVRYWEWL